MLNGAGWKEFVKRKIQRKLNTIKVPVRNASIVSRISFVITVSGLYEYDVIMYCAVDIRISTSIYSGTVYNVYPNICFKTDHLKVCLMDSSNFSF